MFVTHPPSIVQMKVIHLGFFYTIKVITSITKT
jgi:hypothetical protein